MARKRKHYPSDKEPFNRFCPICGIDVKAGEPLHRCDPNYIKKLEKEDRRKQSKHPNRSYDDKLEEAGPLMDSDIYYSIIDEEDD